MQSDLFYRQAELRVKLRDLLMYFPPCGLYEDDADNDTAARRLFRVRVMIDRLLIDN